MSNKFRYWWILQEHRNGDWIEIRSYLSRLDAVADAKKRKVNPEHPVRLVQRRQLTQN
jgi:hypothetical protein